MDIACPHCGRTNTIHDHAGEPRTPQDGDVSLCWGCRKAAV